MATLSRLTLVLLCLTAVLLLWHHVLMQPSCGAAPPATSLKVMVVADLHLAGPRTAWVDRVRRESFMRSIFRNAYNRLHPDALIVLGDVSDAGRKSTDAQWDEVVARFWDLARPFKSILKKIVVGNHDVGTMASTGINLLNLLLVTAIIGHLFTAVHAICAAGDRNALLQFKAELADPYDDLSDWNTNPDCCTWLQSRQYRMTTCNSAGRVTSLTMGKALEYKPGPVYFKVSGGEYGPMLSALTYLEKLDLQTIYSGGATIPSSWAAWTRLNTVTLDVLLAGPLPPQVVKAWPLKSLVLTNNDLTGTLPVELCKSTLKTLQVSGNSFTGQIPSCLSRFPASSFNDSSTGPSGNEGLCGAPLQPCN